MKIFDYDRIYTSFKSDDLNMIRLKSVLSLILLDIDSRRARYPDDVFYEIEHAVTVLAKYFLTDVQRNDMLSAVSMLECMAIEREGLK